MEFILLCVVMQFGLVACRITSLKYCEQALRKIIQNHVRHPPICATSYMVIIWEALGFQWRNIYSALCYSFLHCLVHSARDIVPS